MEKMNKEMFLAKCHESGFPLKNQRDYLKALRALREAGFFARSDDVRKWQDKNWIPNLTQKSARGR